MYRNIIVVLLIAVMLIAGLNLVYQIEDPASSEFVFEFACLFMLYIGVPIIAACYALVYGTAFVFYFIKNVKNK